MMATTSRKDLVDDVQKTSKSIALIYSPIELNEYIVEIISKNSDSFISKKDDVSHFHSVHDAVTSAAKYGAKEFFLCLDNTYDECSSLATPQQFDYIPIHEK